jgi:hypothetical protein
MRKTPMAGKNPRPKPAEPQRDSARQTELRIEAMKARGAFLGGCGALLVGVAAVGTLALTIVLRILGQ